MHIAAVVYSDATLALASLGVMPVWVPPPAVFREPR